MVAKISMTHVAIQQMIGVFLLILHLEASWDPFIVGICIKGCLFSVLKDQTCPLVDWKEEYFVPCPGLLGLKSVLLC